MRWAVVIGSSGAVALILVIASLYIAARLLPFDSQMLNVYDTSTLVLDRNGRPLRAYLANDERWRIPANLKTISPWLVKATLAAEDRRFRSHSGVDWLATFRAVGSDLRHLRIVSGASTLTMQVAGLGLGRERTLSRKFHQTVRALQLEHHATKDEILGVYLTNAPYGGNICGVEAAARRYFNKSAADLTLSESALVAAIPQSPSLFRPDSHPDMAIRRSAAVLRRMLRFGLITRPEYDRALAQKPQPSSHDSPALAPHFCDLVHSSIGGEAVVRTSLDASIQKSAEQALSRQVEQLRPRGVTNGSVVVLDNDSGEVLAMVGSANYNDASASGQVNGAIATRSPGSAMKPLIYALAYERGQMMPQRVLYDVPQQFLNYQPSDFDRHFRGLVTADFALAQSLNLPAIQVLNENGLGSTMSFLRDCGISTLRQPAGDYGLSLAIGTCGVDLLELTNAYAALARGGIFKPVRIVCSESDFVTTQRTGKKGSGNRAKTIAKLKVTTAPGDLRVLSPTSCYFVNRALADTSIRPPESIDPSLTDLGGVAWKTGTSNGFHDAWTIAYDEHFTVGVWVGNMDGRASKALVGSHAAAPVALGLMKRLRGDANAKGWPQRPSEIQRVVTCALTGALAGPDCPTTRTADAPRAGSDKLPLCSVHRRARIDDATSELLCMRCQGDRSWHESTECFWPQEVAAWMIANNAPAPVAPAHFHDCPTMPRDTALKITKPGRGEVFVVTDMLNRAFQKMALQASMARGAEKLYWFIDGELVATAAAGSTAFIEPSAGPHSLRCVDSRGRSDMLSFQVIDDVKN